MGGFFEKPRQDRRAATAALAREGSVAGFTARALASARPRRPAKKDLWSSSAAARASRSYLWVLRAVYISWARMVWTCVVDLRCGRYAAALRRFSSPFRPLAVSRGRLLPTERFSKTLENDLLVHVRAPVAVYSWCVDLDGLGAHDDRCSGSSSASWDKTLRQRRDRERASVSELHWLLEVT